MVKPAAVLVVVALSAGAAFAQSQPGSAAAPVNPGDVAGSTANQTAAAQQDKDPMVCRKLPPPTGTRLGGRTVCLTQKQWDQQEKDSQEALRGVMRNAGGARGPGG